MKRYDLRASTDDIVEVEGPGGEFVLAVEFDEAAQKQKLEVERLATILADAVDLLRDWEDYEPGDPQCTWATRRGEFLKEHEAEGR